MRLSSDNQISKLGKYSFYMFLVYIAGMTGLYFHMDSRIKAIHTIQRGSLELFQRYTQMDSRQQTEINKLNTQIGDLKDDIEDVNKTLDTRLNDLYRFLLSREASAAELEIESNVKAVEVSVIN